MDTLAYFSLLSFHSDFVVRNLLFLFEIPLNVLIILEKMFIFIMLSLQVFKQQEDS